ncbi:MAG: inner membrane protein YpjD [Gemmatimonadales bacterium]
MHTVLRLLNVLLPLGYLLAVLDYAVLYATGAGWSTKSATPLARGLAATHAAYLLLSTVAYGHVPLANVWEAFTFLALALTIVYLVLEWRLHDQATGMFLLGPALFFQFLSSALITHAREVAPILRSSWFGLHVSAALVGYAAFAIAAVYGTLYLLLYRELKGKRAGLIFQRLPNLEILARMNSGALVLGWGCLTLAIVVGVVWASSLESSGELAGSFLSDPKFLSTVVVWILYSACLGGRWVLEWPNRILARISVLAFILMVASSLAVNLVVESFHSFG